MLWAFVPFTNSHIALHFLIHCGPVVSHHVFVYSHDMLWYKACAIDWFPHWVTSFVVFLLYFKELYCERLDEHCLIWERAVWVDREYEYLRSLTFPNNKVTWGTFGFSVAWIYYCMTKMIHFLWRVASVKKKDCSE